MKKGFTLIELLTVIMILGVLCLFVVPNFTSVLTKSKEKTYNAKIKSIESSAVDWGNDNLDSLTDITVGKLIEKGYLRGDNSDKTKMLNPISNESMNNCNIKLVYNADKNIVTAKFNNTGNGCGDK